MTENTRRPPADTSYTRGRGESRHSHFEYGSTHGQWERREGTDFAITSVNVPDRLDTQEVRNRAVSDSALPAVSRFHREDLLRAARWAVALLVLVALGWGVARLVAPLRAAISPAGIGAHVGRALGVPVSVAETALRLSPSPRLIVSDMTVQSGFRLPEVAVHFNWRDVFRGVQTSTWVLGEARVAPLALTGEQALAVLQAVRGASRLPAAVTTIRFESITFTDLLLLPGRYEAVIRRDAGQGGFAAVNVKRLDGEGQMDLEVKPSAEPGGSAGFALFATRWAPPVGPAVTWSEATVQGEFRADLLRVDTFSVGARFGNVNGVATLSQSGNEWRLVGHARSPDLSVGELIRSAAGLSETDAADERLPLRGIAKIDLALAGKGATVAEVFQRATASGSGSLPGAVFSGLNLGLAATHGNPGTAGGVTRLTDLDFEVVASHDGVAVRSLAGKAGSLRVSGSFSVGVNSHLNGSLRPEVASPRGVASAQIQLGGTIAAPTYR
jgi:hypothetical protein